MQNVKERPKFIEILSNDKVDFKKEVLAGVTTFLTMAYIIAVNPNILGQTGMPVGALVTATCLSAGLATILMGVFANMPFALASGMGLNAYFAFSVVLGMKVDWKIALTAVFVEGIIFILLSLFKVREAVINAIPTNLKYAVTAGIGLFIAFIGLQGAKITVLNESTLVSLGNFKCPTVLIAFIGFIVIVLAEKKGLKGSILMGILVSTIIAWAYAYFDPSYASSLGIVLPEGVFKFESIAPIAFQMDFSYIFNSETFGTFCTIMCTFLFVDFFDSLGTFVGVASRANMVDKEGHVKNGGKALLMDAIGTTAGACLGVSTVTTYVESSTGVAAGGRTGWTSIVTGVLFLLAMFLSPIFVAIPSCATAPALIYVGFLMLNSVKKIDFSDLTEGVPAFITIAFMPLTYSIGDGLTFGVLSYVVLNILYNLFFAKKNEKKKVSGIMIGLAVVFLLKLLFI